MYCTNCGSQVAGENPKFCQNCGSPVAPATEATPAPEAAQPEPETTILPPEAPAYPAPVAPPTAYAPPPAETPASAAPVYAAPVATPPAAAPAAPPRKKGSSWCCWVSGCGCLLFIAAIVAGCIVAYPRLKGYIEPYVELSGDPDALAARLSCQAFLMAQDQRNADAISGMLHPKLAERFSGKDFIDEDTSYSHEVLEQTRSAPTDFTIKVQDTPTSGEDKTPSVWIYTWRTDGGQWKLLWFDLEGMPGDELPPELQPEDATTGGESTSGTEEPPPTDDAVNKVR